jgi:hypothetical protein
MIKIEHRIERMRKLSIKEWNQVKKNKNRVTDVLMSRCFTASDTKHGAFVKRF